MALELIAWDGQIELDDDDWLDDEPDDDDDDDRFGEICHYCGEFLIACHCNEGA